MIVHSGDGSAHLQGIGGQAIPVALVQSIYMLVQYGLGSRLGPDIRQLHFGA